MSAESPISRILADAFGGMLHNFADGDWAPDSTNSARVPMLHKSCDYESFCREIEGFDDDLPEDLLGLLSGMRIFHLGGGKPKGACN
jgi:hypothetical protein